MYQKFYESISDKVSERPVILSRINIVNKILTATGFISYPLLLLILFFKKDKRLKGFILIPGVSFLLVTVYRKKINRKRPYESHEIDPLIKKDKQGHSFPSRHIFSMTLIAGCWFFFCPPVGVILLILSLRLAMIRIVGGVHYPSDVIAGGIIGFLCSYITAIISNMFANDNIQK